MTKKKGKEKLNNSCLKIFKFITLLYEDKAFYNDVKDIFKDDISEQSENNLQVALNKYINTLKVFGMKVVKKNNKYILENGLISMDFCFEDLKSIGIINNAIENYPDEKISNQVKTLLNGLIVRMNNEDKKTLNNLTNNYDFSFHYKDLKAQIEECKQACEQNCIVELIYIKNKSTIKCVCHAQEIIYNIKTAFLQVYDTKKNITTKIPIPNILSIKSNHSGLKVESNTNVVFKLKGRLAQNYQLKQGEEVNKIDEQGNLYIINKGEALDDLLTRLMRYSNLCEIISPKFVREKMIEMINETLNKYL